MLRFHLIIYIVIKHFPIQVILTWLDCIRKLMKLIKCFSGITAEKHLKDRIYLLRVLFITVDANETVCLLTWWHGAGRYKGKR